MAWYNKYRPSQFQDVIGQEIVKKVLINSLAQKKVKNAYLLSGPKGTGKTTLARIFANQLNQIQTKPESKIDIVELDAASNTGIEEIRRLIESAKTPPLNSEYKVFIIDEVHMLSKPAMNALLKILEEPPSYLVFLLATTNPEKLIPTVLSRLTKLTLTNHSIKDLVSRLKFVATTEKMEIDDKSLNIIAKRAEGSVRDSINLIETLSGFGLDKYTANETSELLGQLNEEILDFACEVLLNLKDNSTKILDLVNLLEKKGVDGETFLAILLEYLLDLSLSGDRNRDSLIEPVSQILQLKLPINTVSSSIALLQNRLKPVENSYFKANQSKTLKPAQEQKLPPVEKPTVKETVKETPPEPFTPELEPVKVETNVTYPELIPEEKMEIEMPEEENPSPIKKEDIKTPTEPNPELAKQISLEIKSFRTVEGCPPALKMIIAMTGEYLTEKNQLIISVPNGIFQAALKSSKVQTWIKDHLHQKFSVNPSIDIKIGNKIITPAEPQEVPTVTSNEENFLPQQQEGPQEVPASAYQEDNSPVEQLLAPVKKKIKKQNTSNKKIGDPDEWESRPNHKKVFYSVYKQVPENMQGGDVPAFTKEIPVPIKTKPPESIAASEVEEIFEFE